MTRQTETIAKPDTIERIERSRAELTRRLLVLADRDGRIWPLPYLQVHRESAPTELGHGSSIPSFCVTIQGAKEVHLGNLIYRYDSANYLIATDELPITSRIVEASPEAPYLNVVLRLDPAIAASVMLEAGQLAPTTAAANASTQAIDVSPLDADLLDAVVRLARLTDDPATAPFLAPMIVREIIFRLLMGNQAGRLRHLAGIGGHTNRIAMAIERLRTQFDRPIRIEELAHELGMSVSGFHQHFKQVTAMSPLQFQKQLRLQEARRLMLDEHLDAASAGYRVGYDTPSHFNREYKRLFGAPPARDMQWLREAATENASS